jgi:hypothetical protein
MTKNETLSYKERMSIWILDFLDYSIFLSDMLRMISGVLFCGFFVVMQICS